MNDLCINTSYLLRNRYNYDILEWKCVQIAKTAAKFVNQITNNTFWVSISNINFFGKDSDSTSKNYQIIEILDN